MLPLYALAFVFCIKSVSQSSWCLQVVIVAAAVNSAFRPSWSRLIEYQPVWLGLWRGMITCIRCVIPYGRWRPIALQWPDQDSYSIWPLLVAVAVRYVPCWNLSLLWNIVFVSLARYLRHWSSSWRQRVESCKSFVKSTTSNCEVTMMPVRVQPPPLPLWRPLKHPVY